MNKKKSKKNTKPKKVYEAVYEGMGTNVSADIRYGKKYLFHISAINKKQNSRTIDIIESVVKKLNKGKL